MKAKVKSTKSKAEENLKDLIVLGMQDKKATDIAVIDLRSLKESVADFFVLCSGNSDTQVEAIAESVDKMVYKMSGENPINKEGFATAEWILLDYVDIIVHVFKVDKRRHYRLEELWSDAQIEYIKDLD